MLNASVEGFYQYENWPVSYKIPAPRIADLIGKDAAALAAFNRADELIRESGVIYDQDVGGPLRFIMVALIYRRYPAHTRYLQLEALRPVLSNHEFLSCLDLLLSHLPEQDPDEL